LSPTAVDHPTFDDLSDGLAKEIVWSTERKVRDPHVLRAEGDEVVDWRGVVTFDVRAKELTALNGEKAFEIRYGVR
jgi:hypothetical protein